MTYPWHHNTHQRIGHLLETQQLPHAIALTSAPGWGADDLLRELSLILLGAETTAELSEYAHPDFRLVQPDGAEIKVDAIRAIAEFAVQKPQMSSVKVIAINAAHLLNTAASNALLKSLEEPVADTYILLATEHWSRLLPTVRSRCQRFAALESAGLAALWLEEQGVQVSADDLAVMGYAPLSLKVSEIRQKQFDDWLRSIPDITLGDAMAYVQSHDVIVVLECWYRRLIGLQAAQRLSPGAHQQVHRFVDDLVSVRRQLTTTNSANVNLLAESVLDGWCRLIRKHNQELTRALAG